MYELYTARGKVTRGCGCSITNVSKTYSKIRVFLVLTAWQLFACTFMKRCIMLYYECPGILFLAICLLTGESV